VRVVEARAEDPPPSSDLLHIVLTRWRRRLGALRLWAGSPDSVELDRHIILALSSGFADPTDRIPQIRLTKDRFLLFFDGGSRGNPGPGGSGAVIVRARDDFEIIWMASMSFARRTTTNNYAEFQGLCTGLHAAVRHQWHPLTVIGDSAMILSLSCDDTSLPRPLPSGPSTLKLGEQQRLSASQAGTTTIALKIKWPTRQRTSRWMPDAAYKPLRKMLERSSQPSPLSSQTTVSLGRSDCSFRPEVPTGRRHRAINLPGPCLASCAHARVVV
jgi:hypothetical protein